MSDSDMRSASHQQDRFDFLDELRGIAALMVLVFHIGTRTGAPNLAPHGYLAVDFFFILSGFVIAAAYGKRLDNGMTFREFASRRLARMMPIVILGATLGTAYALARWLVAPNRSDSLTEILASAALNVMLLPKWWSGQATAWEAFPVNGPLWSLFFEVIINVVWAGLLVRLTRPVLIVLAIAAMAMLITLAIRHDTMDLGWSIPTISGGLARVSYGFLIGLLIHAMRGRLPYLGQSAAFMSLALIVVALVMPLHSIRWSLPMTILVLPLALVLAVSAGHQKVLPGASLLGAISYPLYGLHVPLLALYSGVSEKLAGKGEAGFEAYLTLPAILIIALLATKFYDLPAQRIFRRFLENGLQASRPHSEPDALATSPIRWPEHSERR
ncbi:MAG: hypothetical protein DI555_00455 [Novosphingobium pentaromativorans]|uniref:Acyltransferase 3 domain-containing protein n=1 Tax=Novosphingobium pentaromativorans TaxID=205844 RepID=A0A2W5QRQ8_9SPHN|nr:MAG: hypothetical protein DI555_00455 [Novosphingobium pentaromativorans]